MKLQPCEADKLDNRTCRAREWVAKSFTIQPTKKVSLFETTIRIVGGFLAAYDLSQDSLFLDKAREVVDRMLPYFESATTGEATRL